MNSELLFYILLPVVAFLYAAVGHGGASGYLALMALFSVAPDTMRPTALILNICVSFISFLFYLKNRHFRFNLFWPYALTSIPAAWVGGTFIIEKEAYKLMLGLFLLFPVVRLTGFGKVQEGQIKPMYISGAMLIGGIIGLLSGMIGIGGGILLSPVILMLHWAGMKQTAAISALFIFVNSIAGMIGFMDQGISFNNNLAIMTILALAGGVAGSWLGAGRFSGEWLKKILALVLLIASVKLLSESI